MERERSRERKIFVELLFPEAFDNEYTPPVEIIGVRKEGQGWEEESIKIWLEDLGIEEYEPGVTVIEDEHVEKALEKLYPGYRFKKSESVSPGREIWKGVKSSSD